MKRSHTLTAIFLALCLCISMAVPAFAIGGSSSSNLYAGGSGTAEDPWHIQTASQLSNVQKNLGGNFVLDNDIDLKDVANFSPIGAYLPDMQNSEFALESTSFHGTFNGNGHKISNLTVKGGKILSGALFGAVSGTGYVHDLVVENANVKAIMYAAGIVGMATDRARLENLSLIGDNNIEGMMQVGGINGGCNIPVLKNCTAQANIKATGDGQMGMNAGIVCGGGDGTSFENCKATGGTVTAGKGTSFGFGGVTGCARAADHITDCSAENVTLKVKDCNQAGGLIGFVGNQGTPTLIDNCSATNVKIEAGENVERIGALIGGSTYLSGVAKDADPVNLKNCTASGTISGGKYVGGIAGWLSDDSILDSSTVTATVVDQNGNALPLVGAYEKQVPTSTFDDFMTNINLIMNSMMG